MAGAHNLPSHFKILQQHFIKRQVIKDCAELIEDAYDPTSDSLLLIDDLEKRATALTSTVITNAITSSSELFDKAIERNKLLQEKEGLSGVPTGFERMNKITGGWQNSDMIVLAARPAMGKTSLALKYCLVPALDGIPVGFFSLEMSKEQLYARLQSQETDIALEKFLRTGLDDSEVEILMEKGKDLRNAPIFIDDTPALTIFQLRNKARKLKRDHDIKMLVIDYLQLMSGGKGGRGNRENEISEISRGVKAIAKELDIPVIALSQLSRRVEERADKIPQLSDLRESGSIEQDADMVQFLYRPEYYGLTEDAEGNSTAGKASVIIAKHRNGGLANVTMNFTHNLVKFTDYSEEPETWGSNTLPLGDDFDNSPIDDDDLPY